jgi:hypothetical protein
MKAIDAYEKASSVGADQNDSTTVAQARMKLAMLMQAGLGPQTQIPPTGTPIP